METFILISAVFAWAMILSCIVVVLIAVTTRNAPDEAIYEKAEKSREKPLIDLKTILEGQAKADYESDAVDSEIDTNFLKNLDENHENR